MKKTLSPVVLAKDPIGHIQPTAPSYRLNEHGDFVIGEYNRAKPFSSFFPGVAGPCGIPMWTFYVNRGQCVCSMGIQDKEHAIMEFLPANRAYQLAASQGFRTFIRFQPRPLSFYEPFQNHFTDRDITRTQRMFIRPSGLALEEVNQTLGLTFSVEYANVPQDDFAGLIRVLRIRNDSAGPVTLEGLDGLPLIIPYGVDNSALKFTRRLTEAFVEVVSHEQNAPLFRSKVEPVDRPEVVRIRQGNFYLGFVEGTAGNQLVATVVDPVSVFGSQADYSYPENFLATPLEELLAGQIYENRFPCAMGVFKCTIPPGESFTYNSIIGHAASCEVLNKHVPRLLAPGYVSAKVAEDQELIERLTQNQFVCSNEPLLDRYVRQNYLDNVLRGGFPASFGEGERKTVYYMYSRKHGDLERDYNHFSLSPTNYSQGNGNFRDVNQNRRSDLLFNPDIGSSNLEHFYNLIQLDGFNPLVIKEVSFTLRDKDEVEAIVRNRVPSGDVEPLMRYLQQPFTPGHLMRWMEERGIRLPNHESELFVGSLLVRCERITSTEHGEGFWTDHWTYNLDLLENYLAVYPEKLHAILFEQPNFTFYDNTHVVQERDDKYVLWDGNPMQLNAVVLDREKVVLIGQRGDAPNVVRTSGGTGKIYRTTLVNKILCLVVNKLASLDPQGVGVEMEADKPNWYDALNGLPGVLGSSLSETLEIKRNIVFLLDALGSSELNPHGWPVFAELSAFMAAVDALLDASLSPYAFWDHAATAKEQYRAATRLGISGDEVLVSVDSLRQFLKKGLAKLEAGIAEAHDPKTGVLATYFINEVVEYEVIAAGAGQVRRNAKGMPCFRAKAFRQRPLPQFLEGPVHYLRTLPGTERARTLAASIRNSGLFDEKLQMYKVNAPLKDEPMEIGRARVFSPGWFENESVWLHMEYKYMLELLRNGLHEEFYADFRNVMVPFFKPEVYGRSILENSSFIVSSANPDPSLHGNGFVARLSGATAEFIQILYMMTVGQKPFRIDRFGQLQLHMEPVLPAELFTESSRTERLFLNGCWQKIDFPSNSFSFMFLGEVLVTYLNRERKCTFGESSVGPSTWYLEDLQGNCLTVEQNVLSGEIAEKVRNRQVRRMIIELT